MVYSTWGTGLRDMPAVTTQSFRPLVVSTYCALASATKRYKGLGGEVAAYREVRIVCHPQPRAQ